MAVVTGMGFSGRKGLFYFTALCFALITLSLAIFPKAGLAAARDGLAIFAEVVLPSLLPFFILSEILLGLGVVHFIGVFLEPLMRPVFNVPGVGAFALSMGLAAGYPMDAVITAKFRRLKLCTRIEGERLLAFTNTADPLFMFGAVAVGMFGYPELGVIIAVTHYLAAFTVGIVFRFYGRKEERSAVREETAPVNLWERALAEMHKAYREDGRPLGQLLADAVKDSVSTLLMIGGFIVLFAVLYQVMSEVGVLRYILPVVEAGLKIFGLNPELGAAVVKGFFEIDIGTMAAAKTAGALADRLIIASAIIAWSGLSVLGQVMSVVHGTDLRVKPFIIARVLHAVVAGFYTYLALGMVKVPEALPAARTFTGGVISRWMLSGKQLLIITGLLIVAGLFMRFLSGYRLVCRTDQPERQTEEAAGKIVGKKNRL
ncbi:MAG TPA: sporulation integral membrane protein YlbJ [Firmicutes bacterium]|nr:sporulation integral membrane protein YlbJ [Bacillota bacterium]